MKCPNCAQDIELTWRRYFYAQIGGMACPCPACHKKFKIKFSWINFMLFAIVFLLGGVATGAVLTTTIGPEWLDMGTFYGTLVLVLPGMIIACSLNRLWEIKYGLLILV